MFMGLALSRSFGGYFPCAIIDIGVREIYITIPVVRVEGGERPLYVKYPRNGALTQIVPQFFFINAGRFVRVVVLTLIRGVRRELQCGIRFLYLLDYLFRFLHLLSF